MLQASCRAPWRPWEVSGFFFLVRNLWTEEWPDRSVLLDQHRPPGSVNTQSNSLQTLLIKKALTALSCSKCPSLWMFWEKSHVQQICRQFFCLEALRRCMPHSSFPSLALLSQDANETQEESLKVEVTSGSRAAESQVGWFPFVSFSWHAVWL